MATITGRYSGPTIYDSVPIVPVEATWTSNEHACKRLQLSLILAFAITIHKSQGLTLDKVVVSLGERETNLGLSYVALSRVRTLEGLAFAETNCFTRFSDISRLSSLRLRITEEERLIRISL